MIHDTIRRHRRSVRLKGYDYSQAGVYVVTICAEGRACLFGEIADGRMQVNDAGRMVQAAWDDLPKHYPNVELDECVVMPNHVHGIIVIVGARSPRPNTHAGAGTAPAWVTLGRMVAYFKYQSAKHINEMRRMPGFPVW